MGIVLKIVDQTIIQIIQLRPSYNLCARVGKRKIDHDKNSNFRIMCSFVHVLMSCYVC